MNILKKINTLDKTILIATHNPVVSSYCGRIINIEDGKIRHDKRL
jgi:ABC-type lipoprotein export system ATPase subunit